VKLKEIRRISLSLFLVYSAAFSAKAAAEGNPVVWTAPSLHRIGISDKAGDVTKVNIAAARNEYESFQIVVNGASSGLRNVNVTISDLEGPTGQLIPQTNFTLYREKYVYVNKSSPNWGGSNQPLGTGWYADALIPFLDPSTGKPPSGATLTAVPFDLKAGANQPIWVDLLVPQTAAAGQYSGFYTVTSDQGKTTGPIALTVWNFALPTTPSLKSSFLFSQAGTVAAQQELLRHRISPSSTRPADLPLMAGRGLNATDTGPYGGAYSGHCTMSSAPSVSTFQSLASARQPGIFLYNYSADEIGSCTNLYPTIRQWAYNMHQAGINNMVSMSPNPALYSDGSATGRSAVDIWVVLPLMYEKSKSQIAHVLQKGDAVWSYNTLVQDPYSPKWEIDFDPVNFRIQPGFINQSLNLTGMLYWRVDRWTADPWNNVNNAGLYSSNNFPGEGMLVYPGKQVGIQGVVGSMRLKWLRDGVEDYEYVQILKNLGKTDLAMKIARSVGPDWTHWTRDAAAIDAAHQQLGQAVNEIMNATNPLAAASVSKNSTAGAAGM
jgi:hypothetical protein